MFPGAGAGCVATGAVDVSAAADEAGAFDGVAVGDEAAGCVDDELLWQPAMLNRAAGSARVAMINLRYINFLLSEFSSGTTSTRLNQRIPAVDELGR
jgi:hypothetical protein